MADSFPLQAPSALPAPPRLIRARKHGLSRSRWLLGLFLIPFVLAGLALSAVVPLRLWVQSHGAPVIATVNGTTITRSRRGSLSYHVRFEYDFAGQMRKDQQQVTLAEFDRALPGQRVPGRAMKIGPGFFCFIGVGDTAGETKLDLLLALLWDVLLAICILALVVPQALQRRLVRSGTVAPGIITSKRSVKGKAYLYLVTFSFTPLDGQPASAERRISRPFFEAAKIGQAVTVLYNPAKPKQCLAYEFCDYEIQPMVG